jgi:hypothetical protein
MRLVGSSPPAAASDDTKMRSLAIAIVVTTVGAARADSGLYVVDTTGTASLTGGLRAYGDNGKRFSFGAEYRRGDRAVAFLGTAIFDVPGANAGEIRFVGLELKQRWRLVPTKWSRIGVRAAVHAGPKLAWGRETLTGFRGLGATAGATLEADVGLFGYFVDAGVEVVHLTMPADSVTGAAPYFSFGVKGGWL